ncbi:putative protein FAR1-RELATED SEQUENCE 10 [Rutidosis leptorrhynchoides]|uniref:putative protein FAR1-RELATED SEQUENCE 10 n=1 Tax=Rutidosis leptorrhynchoides TaxID=125765 RepID=UPI003A9A281C
MVDSGGWVEMVDSGGWVGGGRWVVSGGISFSHFPNKSNRAEWRRFIKMSDMSSDEIQFGEDGSRNWTPNVDEPLKPVVGKKFTSLNQVWAFYKAYARKSGFQAKKGCQYPSGKKVLPNYKYYNCVREGFKRKKQVCTDASKESENVNVDNSNVQVGTDGAVGQQSVKLFNEKHNHSLVNNDDIKFLTASRKFTYGKQLFLHTILSLNVGPVRGFKLMKEIQGGFEQVGASVVDYKNFRRDMSLFIGDRDAQMVVEKLKSNQECLHDFSTDYFTNEDGTLAELFWADEDAK